MLLATLLATNKCIAEKMLLAILLATNKCVGSQMQRQPLTDLWYINGWVVKFKTIPKK